MTPMRFAYQILVCVVVLSRINCVVSEPHGMALGGHYGMHDEKEHIHSTERPCAVCPRQGVCVPHVQCPAHVRPGSHNPQCHLGGTRVGVCCFTGRNHAAESDHKFRSSVDVEDVKAAHNQSRLKLKHWLERAEELQREPFAVINTTAPSYGHHLVVLESVLGSIKFN